MFYQEIHLVLKSGALDMWFVLQEQWEVDGFLFSYESFDESSADVTAT